jgi:hypothetical protein
MINIIGFLVTLIQPALISNYRKIVLFYMMTIFKTFSIQQKMKLSFLLVVADNILRQ